VPMNIGRQLRRLSKLLKLHFNLPCMRMSKSLPRDGPAAA